MRIARILLRSFLIGLLFVVGLIFFCHFAVSAAAKGKLYHNTDSIPYNKVGLLLGTSKFLGNGRINPYYTHRITAAARLVHSGKVRYVIVSGDNSRKDYNEPAMMREDLFRAGVDSARIYMDYAGLRTFDSMVRLREIFGQDSVTVISQPFHNERALYIAKREGIAAIGFNAQDVGGESGLKVGAREKLARVKVFLDYILGEEPKYLGAPVVIPD